MSHEIEVQIAYKGESTTIEMRPAGERHTVSLNNLYNIQIVNMGYKGMRATGLALDTDGETIEIDPSEVHFTVLY